MIISQTPYRMSFFGGGTDYNPYFEKYGGSVISATINKYCYVTLRHLPPFFEHKYQVKWSCVEGVSRIEDIKHPSVRGCLQYLGSENISLTHDGDLPARSGLGSSSSFTVGMLNALHALRGEYVSPEQLAQEAIHVEQDILHENVGVQDQVAAAYGGFNRIYFSKDGIDVRPIIISKERKREFDGNIMLFFTGLQRIASEIAKEQVDSIEKHLTELSAIRHLTEEAAKILHSGNSLREFGLLLDEMWDLKKSLSTRISNERIDDIYERAKKAGAVGGKLMGAGGGGFIFFYVEPEAQANVREALSDLLYIPFEFESGGSRIIYYS